MTIDDLIDMFQERVPPRASDVEAAAKVADMSVQGLCDAIARAVAERFMALEYGFGRSDAVVNNLFGFAHMQSNYRLSRFAFRVYEAFDEGERSCPGDPDLDVPSNDENFRAFALISSETDALPIGPVRQHWAPSAIAAMSERLADAEAWAFEAGGPAFRNLIARFSSSRT